MLARAFSKPFVLRTFNLPLKFNVRGFAAGRLRDENAPKKPMSAYNRFIKVRGTEMRIYSADKMSAQDVVRMCATEWKAMNPEQKQVYQSQAVGQEEYSKKMALYRLSDEYAEFQKKKLLAEQRKKLKEFDLPNTPKRPRNAYILFSMDVREKLKAANRLSMTELTKRIGSAWRELKEDDKAEYESQALKDKKRYTNEMKQFQESAEYREMQRKKAEYLSSLKKAPKKEIDWKTKMLDSGKAKEQQRKIYEAKAKEKKIQEQKKKERERATQAKLKFKAAELAIKKKEKVKQHKAQLKFMEKELKTMLAIAEKAKKQMQNEKLEVKQKQRTIKSSLSKGKVTGDDKVWKVNGNVSGDEKVWKVNSEAVNAYTKSRSD